MAKTVSDYLKKLRPEQKKIVSDVIKLVQEAAPSASLSIKWAQPVFEHNGPVCYIKAFSKHVNFGFWRGATLKSGKGVLETSGKKMAHIKLFAKDDIKSTLFKKLVKEAIELNEKLGNPNIKS